MPYWGDANDNFLSTPVDAGPKGGSRDSNSIPLTSAVHIPSAPASISGSISGRWCRTADLRPGISSFPICTYAGTRTDNNPPPQSRSRLGGLHARHAYCDVGRYQRHLCPDEPYYAWYGQDTWRVTRNLTLPWACAWSMSGGATERYNRALSYFDPNLELPITAAAEAAYARNPVPELPASQFKVRGGSVYAGRNGVPRELWQSELMWLPRISAAYQMGTKTVIRGGLRHLLRHAQRHELWLRISMGSPALRARNSPMMPEPIGWPAILETESRRWSIRFPIRANGTRFDVPLTGRAGIDGPRWSGFHFGRYDRQHPRVQRWRVGVQRELGGNMLVEAAYWGQ